ncbi:MAG: hypothetical protein HDS66_01440 [Bacteroidales bacterium]|nr:hypothetical protein [Bacteroidales bacterium]
MKKIVLSLAVLASVALVSCNKGAANTESESAAVVESEAVVESAAVESEATVESATVAEAPAADSVKA